MSFKVENVSNMNGFNALTQGDKEVEQLLLNNIIATKKRSSYNKVVGFKKTREQLLKHQFDDKALHTLVETCMEAKEKGMIDNMPDILKRFVKDMFEKVMRDHVPLDTVSVYAYWIAYLIDMYGVDVGISKIKKCIVYERPFGVIRKHEVIREMLKEEGVL